VQGTSGHSWEAEKSNDQREMTMVDLLSKHKSRNSMARQNPYSRWGCMRGNVFEVAGKVEWLIFTLMPSLEIFT